MGEGGEFSNQYRLNIKFSHYFITIIITTIIFGKIFFQVNKHTIDCLESELEYLKFKVCMCENYLVIVNQSKFYSFKSGFKNTLYIE